MIYAAVVHKITKNYPNVIKVRSNWILFLLLFFWKIFTRNEYSWKSIKIISTAISTGIKAREMSIENEQNGKAKTEVIGSILKNESSKVRISSNTSSAFKDSIIPSYPKICDIFKCSPE